MKQQIKDLIQRVDALEHTVLRVPDYVRLTGLSRTTASLELRELCQDPTSGIRSMGQRASKVYVKR